MTLLQEIEDRVGQCREQMKQCRAEKREDKYTYVQCHIGGLQEAQQMVRIFKYTLEAKELKLIDENRPLEAKMIREVLDLIDLEDLPTKGSHE